MGIRLQLSSQQNEEDDGASRFGQSTFATQSFPSLKLTFDLFVRILGLNPGNRTRLMNMTQCICHLKSYFGHNVKGKEPLYVCVYAYTQYKIIWCTIQYHRNITLVWIWFCDFIIIMIKIQDHAFSCPTIGSVEKSKQVLKERFLLTNQAPDSQVLIHYSPVIHLSIQYPSIHLQCNSNVHTYY